MRSRTVALVFATTLCAALYGCSSSVQQTGTISGAATGNAPTASAAPVTSPSASLAAVAGLSMTFRIPSDLTLDFQTSDLGSATANQIETVLVYQYEGFIEALSSSEATEANYKFLTVSDALSTENGELDWWKQKKERLTGVDRLYDFTVKLSGTDQAVYSYCEDSTRLGYVNLANSQTIQNTAGTTENYTLRQGILVKGKGELWAVQRILTQDGAASCIGN
ncbi:hypothetical protein KDL01_11620 [Actinospica durhamensis]|uniref:Lipoprotein n=1 Tax=Actinospica durhamensis TaxID=1508375 RepID=A0A941EMU2_9ACTN|nr:hypothetical protein [Actinospica durhamensis]MBR7833920.1 hypothetical protein [Actinospica durhamensis]